MVWDFAEGNPLGDSSGALTVFVDGIVKPWFSKAFETVQSSACGGSQQADASERNASLATDWYPPIHPITTTSVTPISLTSSTSGYAVHYGPFSQISFSTMAVPKEGELVATPDRHGGKEAAETFFLKGMSQAMNCLCQSGASRFSGKHLLRLQAVGESKVTLALQVPAGKPSWSAVIRTGFSVTGTWPMRTENSSRMRGMDSNALASSIVLVCRKRPEDAPLATRREFVAALKAELPLALAHLQSGNIAPVDLAQAAIGPGMAVYTRYAKVLDAQGNPVSVRDALALINHTLDEVLAEQEGEFDADTRWALAWFDQQGFTAGDYGVAETLSTAKNTSVAGMQEAGILEVEGWRGAVAPARGTARRTGTRQPTAGFPSGRSSTTSCASWNPTARPGPRGSSGNSAALPKQPGSSLTACMRLRSERTGPARRCPTTPWSRAGRRSRAWRDRSCQPSRAGCSGLENWEAHEHAAQRKAWRNDSLEMVRSINGVKPIAPAVRKC